MANNQNQTPLGKNDDGPEMKGFYFNVFAKDRNDLVREIYDPSSVADNAQEQRHILQEFYFNFYAGHPHPGNELVKGIYDTGEDIYTKLVSLSALNVVQVNEWEESLRLGLDIKHAVAYRMIDTRGEQAPSQIEQHFIQIGKHLNDAFGILKRLLHHSITLEAAKEQIGNVEKESSGIFFDAYGLSLKIDPSSKPKRVASLGIPKETVYKKLKDENQPNYAQIVSTVSAIDAKALELMLMDAIVIWKTKKERVDKSRSMDQGAKTSKKQQYANDVVKVELLLIELKYRFPHLYDYSALLDMDVLGAPAAGAFSLIVAKLASKIGALAAQEMV